MILTLLLFSSLTGIICNPSNIEEDKSSKIVPEIVNRSADTSSEVKQETINRSTVAQGYEEVRGKINDFLKMMRNDEVAPRLKLSKIAAVLNGLNSRLTESQLRQEFKQYPEMKGSVPMVEPDETMTSRKKEIFEIMYMKYLVFKAQIDMKLCHAFFNHVVPDPDAADDCEKALSSISKFYPKISIDMERVRDFPSLHRIAEMMAYNDKGLEGLLESPTLQPPEAAIKKWIMLKDRVGNAQTWQNAEDPDILSSIIAEIFEEEDRTGNAITDESVSSSLINVSDLLANVALVESSAVQSRYSAREDTSDMNDAAEIDKVRPTHNVSQRSSNAEDDAQTFQNEFITGIHDYIWKEAMSHFDDRLADVENFFGDVFTSNEYISTVLDFIPDTYMEVMKYWEYMGRMASELDENVNWKRMRHYVYDAEAEKILGCEVVQPARINVLPVPKPFADFTVVF